MDWDFDDPLKMTVTTDGDEKVDEFNVSATREHHLPSFGGSEDANAFIRRTASANDVKFEKLEFSGYLNDNDLPACKKKGSRGSRGSLFTDQSSRFMQQQSDWKQKWILVLMSSKYRISVISINILSISQFIFLLYIMSSDLFFKYSRVWIIFALGINTLFLLDLVVHLWMLGFKRILKKTEYLTEFIL